MKKIINSIFISLFLLLSTSIFSQEEKAIVIEDFIQEHETLISYRGNDGEIDWESKNEINKKIRFFIEEKYPNVLSTRNIMWDSYETYLSPYDRHHFHTFIAGVKVKDISRMKYVNVRYHPDTQKVNSTYAWDEEVQDFIELDKEEEEEE